MLTANRIDGMLRLALLLQDQLGKQHNQIDTGILFQGENDKAVMERTIYKSVLDKGIIDQTLYDELELLYKERNKVVHRYIITDLRTEQVIRIVFRYFTVEEKVDTIVNALEQKQFAEKVGLHAKAHPGKLDNDSLERLKMAVKDKHGQISREKS